jgi:hypothetical protein
VKRFRAGLVFKARRLVCHSTLGSRATQKKMKESWIPLNGGHVFAGNDEGGKDVGPISLCRLSGEMA